MLCLLCLFFCCGIFYFPPFCCSFKSDSLCSTLSKYSDWSTSLTCWGHSAPFREYQLFALYFERSFWKSVSLWLDQKNHAKKLEFNFQRLALYLSFCNYCSNKINSGKKRKQSLGLITTQSQPLPLWSQAAM